MSILCIVITLACIVAFAIEVGGFTLYYILKKRPDRIAFVRSFKRGKCAIMFLVAVPLFWIGIVYTKTAQGIEVNMFNQFFTAVQKVFSLILLQFDVASVEALMRDMELYAVAVYLCYFLAILNAGLFTMSFVGQSMWLFGGNVRRASSSLDHLMIFGYNQNSIDIYKSDKTRSKILVDKLTREQEEALYQANIHYAGVVSYESKVEAFMKLAKNPRREHIAIINLENDEESIALCRCFLNALHSYSGNKEELYKRTRIYVFGDPRYQTIYDDIVSDGYGCIRYQNKYQKIAIDFINEYPLSGFMSEKQIDFETSLVKKDVDINVIMLGFGRSGQQIFLTSVANNQFLRRPLITVDGKEVEDLSAEPELKRVKYFVFDKAESKNNKNLNHSYYRYKHECLSQCLQNGSDELEHKLNENADKYLPLPKTPAREYYETLDINDNGFYDKIRRIVSRSKNDANFIIIAFGKDLENIDMAQKLIEKRREWELDDLIIFVKAKGFRKSETMISDKNCYFIGYERDVVYSIERILGDDIYKMAKMRNEIYAIENAISGSTAPTEEQIAAIKEQASVKWYKNTSQMQRESSIYSVLSLRSKLNLIGLDYVKKSQNEGENTDALSYDEYIDIYSGGSDKPTLFPITVQGKGVVSYSLDFNMHSLRTYLAIHEHQRWNSFMISKGIIPSTVEQIYAEVGSDGKHTNGRRYEVRRHGNLTTFEGLVGYRRLLAYRDSGKAQESYAEIMSTPQENEQAYDVIKYDYQLLDDAFWLLNENGFKIIRRESAVC